MPTIDIENYDPAVEPYGDKLHRLARVAFSFIPTCAELFSTLVEDPYNSRVKIWLSDLTNELNNAIIDIEEIKNNEKHNNAILSSIMQSTEIALRTSDKEMHENLIQFILNTIHNQDSDEELNMIYLSTLRQLTVVIYPY